MEVVKDIQLVHLVVQKLEHQVILLQQLLHKEMMVEMEFIPLLLGVHKLLVAVEELELSEQMLYNQVLQQVVLVTVVLEFQVILQDHVLVMAVVVEVEKDWLLDVLAQVELEAAVQVVKDHQHKQPQELQTLAVEVVEQE